MIWESNEEVAKVKEKYTVTILHHNCERSAANNKKLPTNACIVHYLDMKKGEEHYSDHYDICLLYTSPSPRDVEESRMPSSA